MSLTLRMTLLSPICSCGGSMLLFSLYLSLSARFSSSLCVSISYSISVSISPFLFFFFFFFFSSFSLSSAAFLPFASLTLVLLTRSPEVREYVNLFDLDTLSGEDYTHVPWPVLLLKFLPVDLHHYPMTFTLDPIMIFRLICYIQRLCGTILLT